MHTGDTKARLALSVTVTEAGGVGHREGASKVDALGSRAECKKQRISWRLQTPRGLLPVSSTFCLLFPPFAAISSYLTRCMVNILTMLYRKVVEICGKTRPFLG